jgi:hypothetical protein
LRETDATNLAVAALRRRAFFDDADARESVMQRLGFRFGDDVDELFVNCTLPEGWRKAGTDHSRHSNLVDDKGRVRASIFYTAAFYDRSADVSFVRRYYTSARHNETETTYNYVVKSTSSGEDGTVVFDAGPRGKKDYDKEDSAYEQCVAWLNANRPDWNNPLAYWDGDE